jgi:hypothetical protein
MKTLTFTKYQTFKTFSLFGLLTLLMLAGNSLQAQTQTERFIKGTVSDETGPLEGATVVLKDTNIYAVTDATGAFTFPQKLKENDELLVSYLGYKDEILRIDSSTSLLKITMEDYGIIIVGSLLIGNNNTEEPKIN